MFLLTVLKRRNTIYFLHSYTTILRRIKSFFFCPHNMADDNNLSCFYYATTYPTTSSLELSPKFYCVFWLRVGNNVIWKRNEDFHFIDVSFIATFSLVKLKVTKTEDSLSDVNSFRNFHENFFEASFAFVILKLRIPVIIVTGIADDRATVEKRNGGSFCSPRKKLSSWKYRKFLKNQRKFFINNFKIHVE